MDTNVILTNKRRTHAQSNYTNTKLKAWFRRLLHHPTRKRTGSILNRHTPGPTQGDNIFPSKDVSEITQEISQYMEKSLGSCFFTTDTRVREWRLVTWKPMRTKKKQWSSSQTIGRSRPVRQLSWAPSRWYWTVVRSRQRATYSVRGILNISNCRRRRQHATI